MSVKNKRFTASIVIAVMLAALFAGCGGSQPNGGQQAAATTTAAATAAKAEETTAAKAEETTTAKAEETKKADETTKAAAKTEAATTAAAAAAPAETSALAPLDVTFFFWGDRPNQMDNVLGTFNNGAGKDLSMKLEFDFTPLADFSNKIKLKLSAGEAVDACFDAQWISMTQFIAEGTYRDLSKYFNNDEFPGLKAAFQPSYLKNNMLGTGKNYGIPFAQSYGIAPFVYLRGDLRQKYGCEPVTNPETYRAFLDVIVQNEPSMVPYAASISNYNVGSICQNENWFDWENMRNAGIWDMIYVNGLPGIYIYIVDYEVKDVVFFCEPESAFANLPAPYNTKLNLPSTWYAKMAREFQEKGWTERDFMTATDTPAMFYSGKAASLYWDTANYSTIVNSLKAAVPEAEIEVYQLNPVYQQGLKGKVAGQYNAWNFLCIPVTTSDEKADRIMMFYNWMFSSWENHDLFELGIEGVNFELVGDRYRIPAGVDPGANYNMPPYQLTWNPNFIRISADYPDDVVKTIEMQNDPATFYEPVWSGFSFQRENVDTQLSNPDFATLNSDYAPISYGMVADIPGKYAELENQYVNNKNLVEDLGIIKAEFISQLQAFLNMKKAGN